MPIAESLMARMEFHPSTSDEVVPGRKDLLDLLVSNLQEFVVILTDPNGYFTSWHAGIEKQFGYRSDEFIGQHMDLLLPAGDILRGRAHRELQMAADNGRAFDTRWMVTKSGKKIMVEGVTIALREHDGKLAGFGQVLQDFTERRNAEENLGAFARALDHSTVIVRQWDGLIDHWTSGCEHLYGWAPEEAVGKIAHQLLNTAFPAPLDQIQQQLLLSGTWKGELEHTKRDGTHVFVSTHWVLMNDPSDEPLTVIETHSDITARLKIQRELEHANQRLKRMAIELERSNQELEEFARIASHDLSAPITSTRWLVDLLSTRHGEGLDANGRKCLHQITQGLDRMADLVEAVLAHARVGISPITVTETTQVEDALQAAVENLRGHIEMSAASVEYGPLPRVHVETQALNQLLQNLLSNSIKYRRQDLPPVVRISAQWATDEWLFSVSDNGIGIEPEWYERIFQPLQRRHGMEIAGSGIGLATCKKIVTRVGGNIWVESEIGSGSTFFFTLPGPPPV